MLRRCHRREHGERIKIRESRRNFRAYRAYSQVLETVFKREPGSKEEKEGRRAENIETRRPRSGEPEDTRRL